MSKQYAHFLHVIKIQNVSWTMERDHRKIVNMLKILTNVKRCTQRHPTKTSIRVLSSIMGTRAKNRLRCRLTEKSELFASLVVCLCIFLRSRTLKQCSLQFALNVKGGKCFISKETMKNILPTKVIRIEKSF